MFVRRYQNTIFKSKSLPQLTNFGNAKDVGLANIFTSTNNRKYYDALGIPRTATQSDIKTAYYKLSMLYHPDKNKGSEIASQKFRDITAAYEVLGNFKTRKLYDKGIIHTTQNPQYARSENEFYKEPEEDDVQTKFYKAHMRKSEVPHAEGRTPIYDFDEWSRAHYGQSFARRKAAKERFDRQEDRKRRHAVDLKIEYILLSFVATMLGFGTMLWQEANYDSVHNVSKTKNINDGES